jgi:hypothetical protein
MGGRIFVARRSERRDFLHLLSGTAAVPFLLQNVCGGANPMARSRWGRLAE